VRNLECLGILSGVVKRESSNKNVTIAMNVSRRVRRGKKHWEGAPWVVRTVKIIKNNKSKKHNDGERRGGEGGFVFLDSHLIYDYKRYP